MHEEQLVIEEVKLVDVYFVMSIGYIQDETITLEPGIYHVVMFVTKNERLVTTLN